ncbi:threonine/serine exporter [Alginatibacterium sediminis]|uniref:Threonine/serine exporter n=1 Tax=Alginatibacterium sediminis TaxID=2164068 RepID=A0A420E7N4_9ALTE|nr:threonine/serine exporter family protein [Alginatibacterium sediminis]RKF14536.1 threonine/serine exporter [Alginatibacterium sediminis]
MELFLSLVDDAFFSAIPAIGFALIFNVPKRMLVLCACGGAIAHSLRTLVMHSGVSIEWASLVASVTIGLIGVYWSRRYLVPRPVFTVASVIPMIPGTFAFKTIIGVFTLHDGGYSAEVMASVLENGLATLFILMALSFGLALPSILIYRFRPIV